MALLVGCHAEGAGGHKLPELAVRANLTPHRECFVPVVEGALCPGKLRRTWVEEGCRQILADL